MVSGSATCGFLRWGVCGPRALVHLTHEFDVLKCEGQVNDAASLLCYLWFSRGAFAVWSWCIVLLEAATAVRVGGWDELCLQQHSGLVVTST